MSIDKNIFYRAKSKKAVQKHMITPAIWSCPKLPKADDIMYPEISHATGWINLDVREIEQHCINNNLICFYSKGELLFKNK